MSDNPIDRDPGVVHLDAGGAITALVDQQRADVIATFRRSRKYSITIEEPNGDTLHSCHVPLYREDESALPFLVYVAVRAIRDAAAEMENDYQRAAEIVLAAIEGGIGE